MGAFTREEIASQAAETWERLGRVCLKGGHPGRAIAAFQEAQKKDPVRSARLSFNLAQVYEGQGKHREALEGVEDYLRTQPQGTEGYELKVGLQRKLGRAADVVPGLQGAAARDPHNVGLKLLLAREQRKAGQAAAAEKTYEELLRKGPNPDVYRALFALYKEKELPGGEKVLERLDRAVRAGAGEKGKEGNASEASHARAMLVVLRQDAALVKLVLPAAKARLLSRRLPAGQTQALLAVLAGRTRQLEAAEELYRSCINQPGGPGEVEREAYAGLLRVLSLRHKHAAIVAVCKQGLANTERTHRVLFHSAMARAQLVLGKDAEALAAAEAAFNDAEQELQLPMRLLKVTVLSASGQHDKALAECQAVLKDYNPKGGDLREVRVALSSVLLAAGQPDKSEEQLQLVLRADPADAMANNNLGYQWADRNKNLAEAEKLIRKAIDLDRRQVSGDTALGPDADRDNAAYVDSLGWVLFRQGKLAEARRELERAAELPGGDDDPVVWDHLGDVYFRQKEKAKAVEAWRKALALYEAGTRRRTDPRYQEIQDKVKLVKP
jgi:tetratricopeptide (TPR) repeat protein